jgi:Ca-activated chloride channel family protein
MDMSARRLILLAAALLWCARLLSEPALAGSAADVWSDLWRTPDQQGQALLDAGRPAQAAERFHDPRRRAYADLEAGRHQDAAKLLAPFTDPESEYNRGNALAKSGQLQAALAAYDAALKQAPADRDIRHNRDLVERALRERQQTAGSSSRSGRQAGQGAASGQQPQQSAGSGQQAGARGSQAGAGRTASSGSQGGDNQTGNSGRQSPQSNDSQAANAPQAPSASGSGSSREAPGQAQRDATLAANLAREQRQRGGSGNPTQGEALQRNGPAELEPKGAGDAPEAGNLLAGGTQTPKQKPETERQLALDQWLRQIPDSPAGLLQRKFLIEHMMRQQGGEDPQTSEDPQGSGP